ncbi:helicase-related protein [Paenibacillus tarimensis]
MKGWIYAVEFRKNWQIRVSIDAETDRMYWLDMNFRAGVLQATGRPDGREERDDAAELCAAQLWIWPAPLPLGVALRAAALWDDPPGNYYPAGRKEALQRLQASVRRAIEEAGDDERSGMIAAGWHGGGYVAPAMPGAVMAGSMQAIRALHADRGERGAAERYAARAHGQALAAASLAAAGAMQGRALLSGEAHALLAAAGAGRPGGASWNAVLQLAALLGRLRLSSAVAATAQPRRWGALAQALWRPRRRYRCLRCGSGEAHMRRTACAACGRMCAYCEACLAMGRARECELLVLGEPLEAAHAATDDLRQHERLARSREARLRRWGLQPAQFAAAGAALQLLERAETKPSQGGGNREASSKARAWSPQSVREFLLWAVTGAGKTEMIFPLIESTLLSGGRALVATPRRDVVLELAPRLRKAFPGSNLITLYGGSEQRWEKADITLATTHQLLRFARGFELVIIDELDAFPFHGDPILQYAAEKACAPGGMKVLLSATPPEELQRKARKGLLPHARVPVRYHGYPLPVPLMVASPSVEQLLKRPSLPGKLVKIIGKSVARGAQLFIFVQKIRHVEPLVTRLRQVLDEPVEGTSSQDPQRTEKVRLFRERRIRVLVTTTILERGVTVPMSDVIIFDTDSKLFDAASLIQMAGRAGRSADDPCGNVYFISPARNRPQAAAIRQIKQMNRIAATSGYLKKSLDKGQGR